MDNIVEILDELESLENSSDYNMAKIAGILKHTGGVLKTADYGTSGDRLFEYIVEGALRDAIETQHRILDLQDNGFRDPKYCARITRIHDSATFTPHFQEGNNRAETLLWVYIDVAKVEYDAYLNYYGLGKYHGRFDKCQTIE